MTATSPADNFDGFYAAQFELQVRRLHKQVDNRYDAEEIVQDSLFDLFRVWDKAETPEALLSTIIRRKVFKYWGRRPSAKGATVIALGEEADRVPDRVADPAVTVEQRDTIRRAADVMSPIERRIVMGRARQDSAVAIAAEEGVNADAVRNAGRRMEQRMVATIGSEEAPPDLEAIDLAKYIKRLPRQQRMVFSLAIDGYQPAAIAQVLHITSNNARVNLHHATKAVVGMLPALADAEHRVHMLIWWARRNRAKGAFAPRPIPNRPRGMPNQPRRPV